jgi:hypothetical protein
MNESHIYDFSFFFFPSLVATQKPTKALFFRIYIFKVRILNNNNNNNNNIWHQSGEPARLLWVLLKCLFYF